MHNVEQWWYISDVECDMGMWSEDAMWNETAETMTKNIIKI